MIIALEEAKLELNNFREQIVELGNALRIDSLRDQAQTLEEKSQSPDFWNDQEKSTKALQTLKQLKDKIERYENLCSKLEDTITMAELAIEENDESLTEEILSDVEAIKAEEEKQRIEILLSGPYDKNNAILSFHPGAGGTEAQDWAQMLYRMYTRWAERSGFTYKIMDYQEGDEAGLKSASIMIEGENAYGFLKGENGVHRLVRVSPFDANARRQTSFSAIEVIPEIEDESEDFEIRPEDYEMQVYRSSGAGGQKVNKTSSAVRLIHKPSGIVVACQEERSQLQNREKCMRMLASKLYEIEQERLASEVTGMRRSQVGTGMRNERIRTYNFPQGRVTDHRVNLTLYKIDAVMDGAIDEIIDALATADQAEKLKSSQQ